MTDPGAFGLQWGDAEIGPGWQGIVALGFTEPPPPGFVVALTVRLAIPASGILPDDIAVTAPDGLPLETDVMPISDDDAEITLRFAAQGPRGQTRVRLLSGATTRWTRSLPRPVSTFSSPVRRAIAANPTRRRRPPGRNPPSTLPPRTSPVSLP